MKHHDVLDDDAHARATDYLMGTMLGSDVPGYEEHLEGCEVCRGGVDSLRPALEALVTMAPEVDPGPELWDRVVASVRRGRDVQAWKAWDADREDTGPMGLYTLERSDDEWEPTGVVGIEARRLFTDPENDRVTMMVRMAPGTSYPAHRHSGPEECYVLSGDLQVGDELTMGAGDFQRAPAGSVHAIQSSRGGCVLLLTSSLSDELIA